MICYAKNHYEGALKLIQKYDLKVVLAKEFISEDKLSEYALFNDHDKFLHAIQQHKEIHAYVLPNLKMYFHPDTILPLIGGAHEEYFKTLL
jgi:hypothetical protein